jgi:hypothetical protein
MRKDGRMDGRTEVTKLIVAFSNFANAPKNYGCFRHLYQATRYLNPLKTTRELLYFKTQFVPRSKHFTLRL